MARKGPNQYDGERLVKEQVISKADLDKAREREKASGTPWYRQLVQMKKVNFDAVNDVLNYEFHSKSSRSSHSNLGDLLVKTKTISKAQLKDALKAQKRSGKLLGEVLVDEGLVNPEDIAKALSTQYDMPYAELRGMASQRDALDKVPESVAIQKEFIPISVTGDKLTVIVSGPNHLAA